MTPCVTLCPTALTKEATEDGGETQSGGQRASEVGIFTDSLSNLMKIKQGIAETLEEKQLFYCIAKYPHNPTFHHVSAHKDNKKNIEVDKLCNAATNPSDREEPRRHEDVSNNKTMYQ